MTSDRRACLDQGACHHDCADKACFRVACCGPLSGVFPGDEWPDEVREQHGQKRAAPTARIEWVPAGVDSERGRVNGNDVFHLSYPGQWSNVFVLTSPLIFLGDRMGWLGTIEGSDPGPETSYRADGKRPSRAQIIADAEADKKRWSDAKAKTKALAEAILIDFAKSILKGVDEPSSVG